MFKFIVKRLFNKDKPEEASTILEVVKPDTPKEAFDKAVAKVVADNLREDLDAQLKEMCYTEEQVRDTKQALIEYPHTYDRDEKVIILNKYPSAVFTYYCGEIQLGLPFDYKEFLNTLIQGAVDIE